MQYYRNGPILWVILSGLLATMGWLGHDAILFANESWSNSKEYGHAYMIPVVSLFMVWEKHDRLRLDPFTGSWWGVGCLLSGALLLLVGEIGTIYTVTQYALIIMLLGLALALAGREGFRYLWLPIVLLGFTIPLPDIIQQQLTAKLQLLSSQFGAALVRMAGISVHIEGNVIDLGSYKLQVVEACAGLRYLFPLTALSFIAACFFRVAFWMRALLVLSSVPITLFMNAFRIGAIGILVEYWGTGMAEGFIHEFEGWTVFGACMVLLILEMAILARLGGERRPFAEVFGFDWPEAAPKDARFGTRRLSAPFMGAVLVMIGTAAGAALIETRPQVIPERRPFTSFPMVMDEWKGRPERLESVYLDILKLDDYLLATYAGEDRAPASVYIAWYGSQQSGRSAHSPQACLPGGGWKIESFGEAEVEGAGGQSVRVNRVLIAQGEQKQLVYYWFDQRGRNVTSEYAVKWYLLVDSLRLGRTDGALIRLTTSVATERGESVEAAERRLGALLASVTGRLRDYVPE